MGAAGYAFANARARAMKSRLAGRELVRGLPCRDAGALARRRFHDLIAAYGTIIKSYPIGEALLLALVRLHEIENVKLIWRAIVRELASGEWTPHWIPLEALATVQRDAVADCRSLSALADAVKRTPYGSIVDRMRRAHPHDLAAAELGLDRWASRRLADEAMALPPRERLARTLALSVVRERDLGVVRRATRTYGLPPDAMLGAVAHLADEIGAKNVIALAEWTAADGPMWPRLPRSWQRVVGHPADWDALLLAWRHARRELCRRAFLVQPFCLAPGLAVLLLHEAEVRGIEAIAEAGAEIEPSPMLEWALAAGELGA